MFIVNKKTNCGKQPPELISDAKYLSEYSIFKLLSKKRFYSYVNLQPDAPAPGCFFLKIKTYKNMLTYFVALFWALMSPVPNYPNANTGSEQVTIMDDPGDGGDTGGETGTIPPKPPKP
jgi:hypothetical protein